MAGRSAIKTWSGIVARRLGERSLLGDLAGRVYTLLIGICVVRAAATTLIVLIISPAAENRADLALLQFGFFGAVLACLVGLQAARRAVRIDGIALFADTPHFHLFRSLVGRRFLLERPFAVGGALIFTALGWVVLTVTRWEETTTAVLAAAFATAALAFTVYRVIPSSVVRKDGFGAELALTATAVLANPDIRRGDTSMVTTVFNTAIPAEVLGRPLLFVLIVYGLVASGLLAFFLSAVSSKNLAAWVRRPGVPVWAMPLRHVRGGYWAAVWAAIYILYAFSGRKASAMILWAAAIAVAGGIGWVTAFLVACAQRLNDEAGERFPILLWVRAALPIALLHFLPCAMLPFVE